MKACAVTDFDVLLMLQVTFPRHLVSILFETNDTLLHSFLERDAILPGSRRPNLNAPCLSSHSVVLNFAMAKPSLPIFPMISLSKFLRGKDPSLPSISHCIPLPLLMLQYRFAVYSARTQDNQPQKNTNPVRLSYACWILFVFETPDPGKIGINITINQKIVNVFRPQY
jgi:hypothetical protein